MKQYDVLIIDDEQRYADMMAKRLTLRECRVKVSYTGEQGLSAVKQANFHLIVLDLQLPDLYGTEVLKQIKTVKPEIPVIIVTGHGSEADRKECLKEGAFAFFHKPLDIKELHTTLMQVKKKVV